MRTRTEGNYKVEETRTYQFSSPAHTSSAPTPGAPSSAMAAVKNGHHSIDNGCSEYLLNSPTPSETMVTATASRVPLVTPTARRAVTSASAMGGGGGRGGVTTSTRIMQPPIPSNKATVTPAPSSFYERHVRKHINVTSKAVREWYV